MRSAALATLMVTGAITLLPAPRAVASPEVDFCRDMTAVGYRGDCATLAGLAEDVCAQYDRGLDLNSIIERMDAATKDEGLTNYIIAGAPLYFCPEHQARREKDGGGGGI